MPDVRNWYEQWMEDARCKWVDGDLWFPGPGDPGFAKKVCLNDCPVRVTCLDYAMRMEAGVSTWMRQGIYGGMTAQERRNYEPQWLAEQGDAA